MGQQWLRKHTGAFLPALLSVVLFGATVFWLVLPSTENAILAKKKDMISELTRSVGSMLATYQQQEQVGLMTRQEAQDRALNRLRHMRYGKDGKDYFWVTDLAPRMLMHPFRTDLEGRVVADYADSQGTRMFMEMVKLAREDGEGFVSYIWQWKDDPTRLELKLSYVMLFKPWGWLIGTGIYTDDVRREMGIMTHNLTLVGIGVMVLVSLLAGFITWRNITTARRSKLAEEAQAESEEKFRGISANALDGIVMIDPEGKVSFWNLAAEKIFGYTAEEVMGRDMHLLLAPLRFHSQYRAAFSVFKATGQGEAVGRVLELSALKKSGEEFPIELSVAPLSLGGRMHAVGILRDITKRKQGEEALQRSEDIFRRLFQASPIMLSITTAEDGRVKLVNDVALRNFGTTLAEVIGQKIEKRYAVVEPNIELYRQVVDLLRQGLDFPGKEIQLRDKNGEVRDYLWLASLISYDDQECLFSAVLDVTERRRAEMALQESEEKFRQLFHASPVMLAITAKSDGCIMEVNATTLSELGYTREEVVGRTVYDIKLYTDPTQRDLGIEEHLLSHKPVRREITFRRKDGSHLDLLWSAVTIEYEGRDCLLSVLVNITEAKRAQQEKKHLEDRLQQAQKMEAIGTLAGGIAHDFNNILSAVLGYSDLAMLRLPKDDKVHRHIEQVYKAGLRARELVQQILSFSRQTKLEKSPVELRLLLKEALKMLRATIPATIDVKSDLQATNATVMADPSQLHQIVLNLCTNAAQAIGREGGTIRVELAEVSVEPVAQPAEDQPPAGEYLMLTVQDTGCGMGPHIIERIFDPFFTTKGKGEGTGLGLSVVHGIVKELEGFISVESAPGQGAMFKVLLPRYQGDPKDDMLEALALPHGWERIHVVDDEEAVAQSLRLMLESLGYQVTISTSSQNALEVLRQSAGVTDLLLTDLTMPHMDGLELVRQVRRDMPGMPVILLTGYTDDKHFSPETLQELAINKLFLKPVTMAELAREVRRILDQR